VQTGGTDTVFVAVVVMAVVVVVIVVFFMVLPVLLATQSTFELCVAFRMTTKTYLVTVALTSTVDVAVMLLVIARWVVFTTITFGVSKQVHTAPTKEDASATRLLNFKNRGSSAFIARFLRGAEVVTVVVVVVVTVFVAVAVFVIVGGVVLTVVVNTVRVTVAVDTVVVKVDAATLIVLITCGTGNLDEQNNSAGVNSSSSAAKAANTPPLQPGDVAETKKEKATEK
jgi:hypothetical protein